MSDLQEFMVMVRSWTQESRRSFRFISSNQSRLFGSSAKLTFRREICSNGVNHGGPSSC